MKHLLRENVMHTPGPDAEQRLYRIPALFWFDHSERCPCDSEDQMAELVSVQGRVAFVMANAVQIETLRSDAAFYAEGNADGVQHLVRSAKATLESIARAAIAKAQG
jgi:hypothetical protein